MRNVHDVVEETVRAALCATNLDVAALALEEGNAILGVKRNSGELTGPPTV